MKQSRKPSPPPSVPSLSRLEDLVRDVQNANRGNARGRSVLAESLRANGGRGASHGSGPHPDERARKLALADNQVAELDLGWDPEMLKRHPADGVDLKDLWTGPELERLLGEGLHPGLTDEDHTIAPQTLSRASCSSWAAIVCSAARQRPTTWHGSWPSRGGKGGLPAVRAPLTTVVPDQAHPHGLRKYLGLTAKAASRLLTLSRL